MYPSKCMLVISLLLACGLQASSAAPKSSKILQSYKPIAVSPGIQNRLFEPVAPASEDTRREDLQKAVTMLLGLLADPDSDQFVRDEAMKLFLKMNENSGERLMQCALRGRSPELNAESVNFLRECQLWTAIFQLGSLRNKKAEEKKAE